MRIASFTRLYNERANGHLERFLSSLNKKVDDICIYDDGSSDNSQELYKAYGCHVLSRQHEGFIREGFHCHRLLEYVKERVDPDWILWIDGDTVLSDTDLHETAQNAPQDVDAYAFHNVNLWRDPAYYRLDSLFNDLWPTCFWHNRRRNLQFFPAYGLHGRLFPQGINKVVRHNGHKLLHYGFASYDYIIRKYQVYKRTGQSGPDLLRLIDERGLVVAEAPKEWFPPHLQMESTPPPPSPIIKANGYMIDDL